SPAPLLSLQHGTTFLKNDVPSTTANSFGGLELFSSAGFIVLMPDFIGYGKSSAVFHPYYDKAHSAMTVIDMIKAAKKFLANEGVSIDDRLFLAGYSEGGYVTLAAAEEIEKNPSHGLVVSAVAAGAGGYDLMHMLKSVAKTPNYAYPAYLGFVLMSYNATYDWDKPLDYFFAPKYANVLSKYMDGLHDGWFINQRLPSDVRQLFNPTFYRNLQKPGTEAALAAAVKRNTIFGWKATIPIRLYHGTTDEIIPHENSELTLEQFRAAGAKDVALKSFRGGTHGSSFAPMMEAFIPWFHELAFK
ncbi:MAG TPA: alpha/beta fold hydrolase, partial [Chryseosolibacter sp.]|nr:alpha/beta fold hydrolase [Chryseosolibacter sp.]